MEEKYKLYLFMWHLYAKIVMVLSLHFAPYKVDVWFFCLFLEGAGATDHNTHRIELNGCSVAKPQNRRGVSCTCFSNYQ
jgi:hypothetical protein